MKDGTLDGIGAALARLKPPMPAGLARGLLSPSGTSGGFRTARRESVQCLCFSFVAMVATGQFFQFFRFQHSQERELFMRIQNSFAAAVAAAVSAVVFSAAFQPAEAALVTIDNFTQVTGTTLASGTTGLVVNAAATNTITGPLFDQRSRSAAVVQPFTPRQKRDALSSVGSGIGTLQVSTSGTTNPDLQPVGSLSYTRLDSATVDLLAATAGDFQGFKIVTGPTNFSSTALLSGYVSVGNNTSATFSQYYLPGGAFWAPNTTYFIPFASFTGNANFASVEFVEVGFDQYGTNDGNNVLPGNVGYNATAQFTLIAVPEPTQLVSVAAVGAMFGAWRLRKLRRSREVAGDATAG